MVDTDMDVFCSSSGAGSTYLGLLPRAIYVGSLACKISGGEEPVILPREGHYLGSLTFLSTPKSW